MLPTRTTLTEPADLEGRRWHSAAAPLEESFSLDISNTGLGDTSVEAGVISKQVSKVSKARLWKRSRRLNAQADM